ncbi:hypothetical protein BD626DRAFT_508498 [Schizophyllum amplum]|uniref:Protein kinase domain-containing protein n=1 Tax=Schizophyllum amplum TaxID=97359 RepID=A0A550C388_9AGAR|nr:hypothetical protein BD626DRAFT_508498 [Auriculariopsis ampla]
MAPITVDRAVQQSRRRLVSTIRPQERWWVDHQPWLESRGYLLRPRFRPGWEPSWHNPSVKFIDAEDRYAQSFLDILDATRTSDGVYVVLKRVNKQRHPAELEITTLLSSPLLSSDPRNHCAPVLEVLSVPDEDDTHIMVLPLLREYDQPRFDTVGEVVACLQQVFEVRSCLRPRMDIHTLNLMMDAAPLYKTPFHPAEIRMRRDWKGSVYPSFTRTQRPVKYYTVPEFLGDGFDNPYNPFPTDVYCLGNWIREDFLEGVDFSRRLGLEFLRPLVDEMTRIEPDERPTMDQVLAKYESLINSLSSWKLRSRVGKEGDNWMHSMYLSIRHWARRVQLVALRRPAVPSPFTE